MERKKLISLEQYCKYAQVEDSFIMTLHEYGFIKCEKLETRTYILEEEISEIERISRLHYDLGINMEGIDALNHILERMQQLQNEMVLLKNRLKIYEQ